MIYEIDMVTGETLYDNSVDVVKNDYPAKASNRPADIRIQPELQIVPHTPTQERNHRIIPVDIATVNIDEFIANVK